MGVATASAWPDELEATALATAGAVGFPGVGRVFDAFLMPQRQGEKAPSDWRQWLTTLFPRHFARPLAPHHVEFWKWVLSIQLGVKPDPFIGIWGRGEGKSSSAEGACVALGVRGKRRYALYIRETQELADKSLQNIAAMFEEPTIARFYPEHANRKLSKFGQSKGWRRNRLWTAGGFVIDALGLDVAARGVKVEDQRPDLFVFDDIDGRHDSAKTTAWKEEVITDSILPAGSPDVAVLGIQNLIIRDGIFSRLADGRASYLATRHVSGPHPAIAGLQWEWQMNPQTGMRRGVILAGRPTWPGVELGVYQRKMDDMGPGAFLRELQHKVKERAEGVALRFDPATHQVDMTDAEARELVAMGRAFGGIDFGWWRFAFTLWGVDRHGAVTQIDEYFSQQETASTRARHIHELCQFYGITGMLPIWGDAANPQDIAEMNRAFQRGWPDDDGVQVKSKLRVVAVSSENKARRVAIDRLNDLLDRRALLFRRGIGSDHAWWQGKNAGNEGTQMRGSRLLWEIDNWSFPVPKEGDPQAQDADDKTADGADMVASMRYAIMSGWRAALAARDFGVVPEDKAWAIDWKKGRLKEPPHALDLLVQKGRASRAPGIRRPRPRTGR